MRTSLTNVAIIESFLTGMLRAEDRLLFEARLLTDPDLEIQTRLQKKVYELVRLFGRKQLKTELQAIHARLITHPDKGVFQKEIANIFHENESI